LPNEVLSPSDFLPHGENPHLVAVFLQPHHIARFHT
jgi:hypothetical protein